MITDVAQAIMNTFNSSAQQVDTFTPANVEIGDVFTLTTIASTGLANTSDSVIYTAVDTSATTVSGALITAWNLEAGVLFSSVTATGTSTVILTADAVTDYFTVVASVVDISGNPKQTLAREGTTRAGGDIIRAVLTGGLFFTEAAKGVSFPYGVFTWDSSEVDQFAGDNRSAIEDAAITVSFYTKNDDGALSMFDIIQKWITLIDSAFLVYPPSQYTHLQITRNGIVSRGKIDNVWAYDLQYSVMYEH
jgi:hypothetical protein